MWQANARIDRITRPIEYSSTRLVAPAADANQQPEGRESALPIAPRSAATTVLRGVTPVEVRSEDIVNERLRTRDIWDRERERARERKEEQEVVAKPTPAGGGTAGVLGQEIMTAQVRRVEEVCAFKFPAMAMASPSVSTSPPPLSLPRAEKETSARSDTAGLRACVRSMLVCWCNWARILIYIRAQVKMGRKRGSSGMKLPMSPND